MHPFDSTPAHTHTSVTTLNAPSQIEGLLSKYASHLLTTGKTLAAIELYRKANKATESAMLLAKMALDITKEKVCVGGGHQRQVPL